MHIYIQAAIKVHVLMGRHLFFCAWLS